MAQQPLFQHNSNSQHPPRRACKVTSEKRTRTHACSVLLREGREVPLIQEALKNADHDSVENINPLVPRTGSLILAASTPTLRAEVLALTYRDWAVTEGSQTDRKTVDGSEGARCEDYPTDRAGRCKQEKPEREAQNTRCNLRYHTL